MNRPYVFCHMMCALDGKIMGGYMETPQGIAAGDAFYDIAFGKEPFYHHQGWLSGRVTTDDNFTFYRKPDLDKDAPAVPAGDFIAQPDFGMFYVSVDPHGKLGWKSSTLRYVDTTAHVVEVLTEQVGNAYRAFLRKLGISYIIAGETELDHGLALSKLKEEFNIETLMLGGGGRREPGYASGFPSRRRHFGEQGPWLYAERGEGHGRRGGLAALWHESIILSRRF